MKPLVSVVMSVYNGEAFVAEAVKSILRQSFENFEFIIGNDGSTDKTANILRSFSDKRIKLTHFRKRLTLTLALNKLLKKATGSLIARMDADDRAHPQRLAQQTLFLQRHAKYALVGSWFRLIDADGTKIRTMKMPVTDGEIRRVVMRYNPVCHPSMMFRKSLIDTIGVYDPDLNGAEDYDLVLRALTVTKVANIPRYLLEYRIVDTSVSLAHMDRVLHQSQRARVKALRQYNYPRRLAIHLFIPSITALVPSMLKVKLLRWAGYV